MSVQESPTAAIKDKATRVLIQGADALGNPVATDFSGDLVATVTPSGPVVTFTLVSPGVVHLSFTASTVATYNVAVGIGGVSLTGAPLTIAVAASLTPDLTQTIAWGSMLEGAHLATRCVCHTLRKVPCQCSFAPPASWPRSALA
jgi:hypothetical protein